MRRRLIEALDAICNTRRRISYKQAFDYLCLYMRNYGAARDPALAKAFTRAGRALERHARS